MIQVLRVRVEFRNWRVILFSSNPSSTLSVHFDYILSGIPRCLGDEEVVAIKGKAKSKINLGEKVILTYDDVKLIFEEDKLVDAQ